MRECKVCPQWFANKVATEINRECTQMYRYTNVQELPYASLSVISCILQCIKAAPYTGVQKPCTPLCRGSCIHQCIGAVPYTVMPIFRKFSEIKSENLAENFGKFSEIENYGNFVKNFRKYTCFDRHSLNSQNLKKMYVNLMIDQMSHECDMKDCES